MRVSTTTSHASHSPRYSPPIHRQRSPAVRDSDLPQTLSDWHLVPHSPTNTFSPQSARILPLVSWSITRILPGAAVSILLCAVLTFESYFKLASDPRYHHNGCRGHLSRVVGMTAPPIARFSACESKMPNQRISCPLTCMFPALAHPDRGPYQNHHPGRSFVPTGPGISLCDQLR